MTQSVKFKMPLPPERRVSEKKVRNQDKNNRQLDYKCSRCGIEVGRDRLTVKRVQFAEMGQGGKVLQSRNTEWLCVPCLTTDPDYQRPKLATAPGNTHTKLAKEYHAAASA